MLTEPPCRRFGAPLLRDHPTRLRVVGQAEAAGDPWFPAYENCQAPDAALRERARIDAAEACRGCPLLPRCRSRAFELGEWWGIWGGQSAFDRRAALARALFEVITGQPDAMTAAGWAR